MAAVAPLAVRRRTRVVGVGGALITELIDRAEVGGLPLVVLLGDHTYYPRFGFEPAGPLGIVLPARRSIEPALPGVPVLELRPVMPAQRSPTYCWEAYGA